KLLLLFRADQPPARVRASSREIGAGAISRVEIAEECTVKATEFLRQKTAQHMTCFMKDWRSVANLIDVYVYNRPIALGCLHCTTRRQAGRFPFRVRTVA